MHNMELFADFLLKLAFVSVASTEVVSYFLKSINKEIQFHFAMKTIKYNEIFIDIGLFKSANFY